MAPWFIGFFEMVFDVEDAVPYPSLFIPLSPFGGMTDVIASADPEELANALWVKNYKMHLLNEAPEPRLYIMCGLPLSGKSYLARRIIERSTADVVYVENDLVRRQIMDHFGLEKPSYTPEEHGLVYNTSHALIYLSLSFSYHTIFDATNLNEKYRQSIYEIAETTGADVLVIKTIIDEDTAKERAEAKFAQEGRKDHSDAGVDIYHLLSKEDEPVELCSRPNVQVNTSEMDVDALIDEHDLLLK